MRVFIVLIWCFWFVGVDAQNRSIVFREGNWEKILKQAKKEKKLIFVDCYTSWCGPCKMLAKNVFTQDKVADFYNTEFVCVGNACTSYFLANAGPSPFSISIFTFIKCSL